MVVVGFGLLLVPTIASFRSVDGWAEAEGTGLALLLLRYEEPSLLNFRHNSAISSLFSFFSVMRFFNHLFSVSNWPIRVSNCATFSVISFAVRSNVCSRCFFFTRNRALAAVLRLRLSSSAARREASSSDVGTFVTSAFRLSPARGEITAPLLDDVSAGDDKFEDAGYRELF